MTRRRSTLDEAALGAFYDRHAPEAYGLALGIVRKPSAAEDITCQAFLETWGLSQGGEDPRRARTLLLATVHRRAAAAVRDAYPRPKRRRPQPEVLPGWLTLRRETAWGVLSVLSEIEREVVELAYFGRCRIDEIAARLHLSLREVDEYLQSALAGLRDQVGAGAEATPGDESATWRGAAGATPLVSRD